MRNWNKYPMPDFHGSNGPRNPFSPRQFPCSAGTVPSSTSDSIVSSRRRTERPSLTWSIFRSQIHVRMVAVFNPRRLAASLTVRSCKALRALQDWRARRPDTKPEDFIFPSEKLRFKGEGAADKGEMSAYNVDLSKQLGSWKKAWSTAKREAKIECRLHDLRHLFISEQVPKVVETTLDFRLSLRSRPSLLPGS